MRVQNSIAPSPPMVACLTTGIGDWGLGTGDWGWGSGIGDRGLGIGGQIPALIETHFKGWAIPGIVPPGAHAPPEVAPDETLDATSGHFRIFQFRNGHRFST